MSIPVSYSTVECGRSAYRKSHSVRQTSLRALRIFIHYDSAGYKITDPFMLGIAHGYEKPDQKNVLYPVKKMTDEREANIGGIAVLTINLQV